MCQEHIWKFSRCRHSSRSRHYCEAARRAQRKAESGCCGFLVSTPENVCRVVTITHCDSSPCRQCQRAFREEIDREARQLAEAKAQAKAAAKKYGWVTATAGGSGGNGGSGGVRRDSHISSSLYRQAVSILPESEYRENIPAPPARTGSRRAHRPASSSRRDRDQGRVVPLVPLPPSPAVARGQGRKGRRCNPPAPSRPSGSTQRSPEERLQAQREIRNSYNNIIRSAGLPLPLPRPRHESADEFDEPLPDDDFLDMVSRAG